LLPTVKVITGSLQGVLRVHQPHQQGYHIEDILLEAQLDSSILQLAAGNFMGYVAVLVHNCHHAGVETRPCTSTSASTTATTSSSNQVMISTIAQQL
jgi:hypothetical protein